jgi:hypothetical protein
VRIRAWYAHRIERHAEPGGTRTGKEELMDGVARDSQRQPARDHGVDTNDAAVRVG